MVTDMSFKVVKNHLSGKSFAKSLFIENKHYIVRIFYVGDYEEDLRLNQIDIQNISVSCKSKDAAFMVDYSQGRSFIELNEFTILFPEQVDEFQNQLEIARNSAIELNKIMNQYFPINMQLS